ncbi:MAG TPA: pyridoxamine 5'-phosphate oxidase, partial [Gemmatimonadales bacterium]|nr:pyridoxamine 5'-phosphate oxidase [Gemmatimonadales bacterium]
ACGAPPGRVVFAVLSPHPRPMSLLSRIRALLTAGQGVLRGLPDATADRDPLELFREWFAAAAAAGIVLPEAMAVATATPGGAPSVRMMLLKGVDGGGFVFFTNYESRKAMELESNPRAALVFHWAILQRQVRVEGAVTRLSPEASEAYFRTRPRGSRIGAWASRQSRPLGDRAELEARVREHEARFAGGEVPLPDFWGGYRLAPQSVEFWQGRINRLHDRLRFERAGPGWRAVRLYP